jgi:dGTPase
MGELLACSWQAFVVKVIRSILTKYVYPSRSVISSELKGRKMLEALLDHFIPAVLYYGLDDEEYKPGAVDNHFIRYMPDALKSWYMNRRIGDEAFDLYLRFLMVVDFISGMTDSEAIQLGEIV